MSAINWEEKFGQRFSEHRLALLELLRTLSYEERHMTLSSGLPSNFYIDCKQAVLTARGHFLAGYLIYRLIAAQNPEIRAVGGLTMGADPIASAASLMSYILGPAIHAFYIRKEPKPHGTSRWIEGTKSVPPGTKVAILEDVITTGASAIKAIERAREHGLNVCLVVALVDRDEENGRQNVEALGVSVVALFNQSDFRPVK